MCEYCESGNFVQDTIEFNKGHRLCTYWVHHKLITEDIIKLFRFSLLFGNNRKCIKIFYKNIKIYEIKFNINIIFN